MCTQNVITFLEFELHKNTFQTKQSLLMKHFAVVKQTMDYSFTEVVAIAFTNVEISRII